MKFLCLTSFFREIIKKRRKEVKTLNKVAQGVITGTLVGAAVGVAMLMRRNGMGLFKMANRRSRMMNKRAGSTFKMVRDRAMHWTSGMKNETSSFTQKLLRRLQ